jgi:hypothetical protein
VSLGEDTLKLLKINNTLVGACGGILIRIELLVGDITRESQGDINNNNSKP